MLQFFDTLTDDSGNSLLGATVTVTAYPGGGAATIYSSNGTVSPIAGSVVSADITGQVSFFAPDGAYILTYTYKGTPYKVRSPVQFLDPMGFVKALDSGTANNVTVSGSQYPAQKYDGLKLEVYVAATNTGATEIFFQGDAGYPAVQPGGNAMASGMLQANGLYRFEWVAATSEWQLVSIQSQPFYPISAAETAAGVTPTNYGYYYGNVLRYGADPTGIADSTSAFQQAHNANSFMTIPAGTFLLNQIVYPTWNSTLSLPNPGTGAFVITKSDFSMTGVGVTSQIISSISVSQVVPSALAIVNVQPWGGTQSNLTLADFRITGPVAPFTLSFSTGSAANASSFIQGLNFHAGTYQGGSGPPGYNITDATIRNVIAEGFPMAGIIIGGATVSSVYYTLERGRFYGCIARYCQEDGFNCYASASDLVFEDCHVHDVWGLGHEHGTAQLTIQGGTVRRCGQGGIGTDYNSTLSEGYATTIQGVTISDIGSAGYSSGSNGIQLGQTIGPYATMVSGNEIWNVTGNGMVIEIGNGNNLSIRSNSIYNVGYAAAAGSGTPSPVCYGILVDGGGSLFGNVTIVGNDINNNLNASVGTAYKNTSGNSTLTTGIGFVSGSQSATLVVRKNTIQSYYLWDVSGFSFPTQVGRENLPYLNNSAQVSATATPANMALAIPPAKFNYARACFKFRVWGTTAANADNKQLSILFGTLALLGTLTGASSAAQWNIDGIVTCAVAGTAGFADYSCYGAFNGAIALSNSSAGSVNTLNTNTLSVTATGTATASDITIDGLYVEFPDTA